MSFGSSPLTFRIVEPAGEITPAQLADLAEIARAHGASDIRVTTDFYMSLPQVVQVKEAYDAIAHSCISHWLVPESEAQSLAQEVPDTPQEELANLIGWINQEDGLVTLGAGFREGYFPAQLAAAFVHLEKPIRFTTYGTILIADLTEPIADAVIRVAAPAGLIFDINSPYLK